VFTALGFIVHVIEVFYSPSWSFTIRCFLSGTNVKNANDTYTSTGRHITQNCIMR
jgi:hypothetical protein